jgi:hypothetical protein
LGLKVKAKVNFRKYKFSFSSFFITENEIKCQILNGSAGHAPVAVSMADVGLAQDVQGEGFHFVYQSHISHIWPKSGSLAGNS